MDAMTEWNQATNSWEPVSDGKARKPRNAPLYTYLTEDEKNHVATRASAAGMSASEFLRTRAFAAGSDSGATEESPGLVLRTFFDRLGDLGPSRTLAAFKDALKSEVLVRALQHEMTSDASGLLPVLTFPSVTKFVDANRYLWNVIQASPMPEKGATFKQPVVTQETQVDTQAAQGDVLASRKLTVTYDTVPKVTCGGTLAMPEQGYDWADPAELDLIVQSLAEQYAIDTEGVAGSAVTAAATHTTTCADFTDAGDVLAALVASITQVRGTANRQPRLLLAGGARSDDLMGLTDANDKPVLNDMLAATNLTLVHSFALDDDALIVADGLSLRAYETPKGVLLQPTPGSLEVVIGYRGYATANARTEGLCAVVAA